MQRLTITLAAVVAMAIGCRCQSLIPPKPEPYSPYLSELMFNSLGEEGVTFLDYDVRMYPVFFKSKRVLGIPQGDANEEIFYAIDTVMPNYISMRASEDKEALDHPSDDRVMLSQLGVLPGTKKPECVYVSTLYPGGIPMSDICFFRFGSEKSMREKNTAVHNALEEALNYFTNSYIMNDSVQVSMRNLAAERGLMDALVDTIDYPEDVSYDRPVRLDTKKLFKSPTITDFFIIPSGKEGKEVKDYIAEIPFAMISYEVDPADMSITARLNYTSLVNMEIASQLKPYALTTRKYLWDGKKYKLLPPPGRS